MWRIVFALVSSLVFLAPGGASAAAGYVHDITGKPTVSIQNGPPRELKVGDLLDPGQTIRTPAGGGATIKFADGQVMILRESTAFRIDDYAYDAKQIKQSRAIFNLIAGGMRAISGIIGSSNKEAFKLTAGTVTIGIRGTDIDIQNVLGQITAAVTAGALVLVTPQGVSNVGTSQYSTVTPNGTVSVPTNIQNAPAAVRAAITSSLVKANTPLNTPVVVAASAAAAAAKAVSDVAAAQQKVAAARAAAAAEALKTATAANRAALEAAAKTAADAAKTADAAAANAAATASQTLTVALNAAVGALASAQAAGANPVATPAAPSAADAAAAKLALENAQKAADAAVVAAAQQATATPEQQAAAAALAAQQVAAAAAAAQAAAAAAAVVAPVRCDPVFQAQNNLASCS